jgi:hypothetical protein
MTTETIDRKTGEIIRTAEAAPAAAPAQPNDLQRLLDREYDSRAMLEGDSMDKMLRMAEVMASGKTTIPQHLRGSVGDCMAVITQAMAWGMNPFQVAQKTHLVNGTLGYEAQLVIAVINSSRLLATRLNFRWSETNWGAMNGKSDASAEHFVEVWATLRGEAEPRVLRVTMAQVGKVRNSPNWEADPRQQIGYLAAKRWARLNAPDVILGVYTPDELEEQVPTGAGPNSLPRNAPPATVAKAAAEQQRPERTEAHVKLIEELEHLAFKEGAAAFQARWKTLPKEDRAAIGLAERDRMNGIGEETDAQTAKGVAP